MIHITNSKLPFVFLIVAAVGASFFLGNNHNLAIAQPNELNIGNTTSESSDTFFQLDDSIEATLVLINETQDAISNNNTTEAVNLLNQAYNELTQIQNNANNLIWDESNEGA
ncbi:MAG: hypothetical protein L0H55_06050 [Candidatus Nitrosocosmicus sp.]|nr:hypothetical protein [Candidatus Nitrosocosmicus sp.]